MNKFASELVPQNKYRDFHERISSLLFKKISFYYTNCCVEAYREKHNQYLMEVLDEEPNVWACINRIIDQIVGSVETSKYNIKGKKYINFGTGFGYSSTDDHQDLSVFKGALDINEVEDTCDDAVTRIGDATKTFMRTDTIKENAGSTPAMSPIDAKPDTNNKSRVMSDPNSGDLQLNAPIMDSESHKPKGK